MVQAIQVLRFHLLELEKVRRSSLTFLRFPLYTFTPKALELSAIRVPSPTSYTNATQRNATGLVSSLKRKNFFCSSLILLHAYKTHSKRIFLVKAGRQHRLHCGYPLKRVMRDRLFYTLQCTGKRAYQPWQFFVIALQRKPDPVSSDGIAHIVSHTRFLCTGPMVKELLRPP